MQKHKTMFRVIAVILSALMLLTVIPFVASAVEATEHSLTVASRTKTKLAPGVTETSVVSYDKNGKYYYYENYAKKAGAVRVGDDIYYFGANTYTNLADGNYYISETWMNGVLPAGNYLIQGGKIVLKNGMYEEGGKLYYYENNNV